MRSPLAAFTLSLLAVPCFGQSVAPTIFTAATSVGAVGPGGVQSGASLPPGAVAPIGSLLHTAFAGSAEIGWQTYGSPAQASVIVLRHELHGTPAVTPAQFSASGTFIVTPSSGWPGSKR